MIFAATKAPPFDVDFPFPIAELPSGKRLHSELENHHVQWEGSTISTGPFSIANC